MYVCLDHGFGSRVYLKILEKLLTASKSKDLFRRKHKKQNATLKDWEVPLYEK